MISLEQLRDFRVGQAEDAAAGTGCTVIICPEGAVAGVDVRGGGPASRETELLRSDMLVEKSRRLCWQVAVLMDWKRPLEL